MINSCIVSCCIHPSKEMFYGLAKQQEKSYTLMTDHRIYTHTKSIEALIMEYEELNNEE